MEELARMPTFWVGVSTGIVVLVSLTGIFLFPNEVKVVSPILMVIGLFMVLFGVTRRR